MLFGHFSATTAAWTGATGAAPCRRSRHNGRLKSGATFTDRITDSRKRRLLSHHAITRRPASLATTRCYARSSSVAPRQLLDHRPRQPATEPRGTSKPELNRRRLSCGAAAYPVNRLCRRCLWTHFPFEDSFLDQKERRGSNWSRPRCHSEHGGTCPGTASLGGQEKLRLLAVSSPRGPIEFSRAEPPPGGGGTCAAASPFLPHCTRYVRVLYYYRRRRDSQHKLSQQHINSVPYAF